LDVQCVQVRHRLFVIYTFRFRIDTPRHEWALNPRVSDFLNATTPSTFHELCDQHNRTLTVARHGAVPETSNFASSPAWVEDADWVFGGYVSNFYASAVLM
jgi:hypothetical protein